MKAFLFTHSSLVASEEAHQRLSGTRAIATWFSPFPYSAMLLSDLTVNELTAVLNTHFQGVWFILAELTPENCNGLLPVELWDYVTDPFKAWTKKLFAQLPVTIPEPPSIEAQQAAREFLAPHK